MTALIVLYCLVGIILMLLFNDANRDLADKLSRLQRVIARLVILIAWPVIIVIVTLIVLFKEFTK
jgi:hypothetical protein